MGYLFNKREYVQLLKSLLTPNEIHDSVESINIGFLYEKGFRTIFLDIDNTVLAPGKRNMSLQKEQWVEELKSVGFKVYAISNNTSYRRVQRACKQLDIEGIYMSLKPFAFNMAEIVRDNYIDPKRIVVIGDQVLTDVIMSNWIRAYSILVQPIDGQSSFIKAIQHEIELFILKKLKGSK